MSRSTTWKEQQQLFKQQLLKLEDILSKRWEHYVLPHQSHELKAITQRIEEYMSYLHQLLERSEPPVETVVMIDQDIEVEYVAEGVIDSYRIVFPDEVNLEYAHISLFSPVGMQLLLTPLHAQLDLDTPMGTTPIRIHNIGQKAA